MSQTFLASTQLTTENCGKCGGVFALSQEFLRLRREKGGSWYCPYCQEGWHYSETEVMRLQKQIAEKDKSLAAERARHDQTKAKVLELDKSLVATKGVVTKMKNRVSNGVCPCCHRSFTNVSRHMKTKHPEFQVEERLGKNNGEKTKTQ